MKSSKTNKETCKRENTENEKSVDMLGKKFIRRDNDDVNDILLKPRYRLCLTLVR